MYNNQVKVINISFSFLCVWRLSAPPFHHSQTVHWAVVTPSHPTGWYNTRTVCFYSNTCLLPIIQILRVKDGLKTPPQPHFPWVTLKIVQIT